MSNPPAPSLGPRPSLEAVRAYYLRPDILAEFDRAARVRDLIFVYRLQGDRQDTHVRVCSEKGAPLHVRLQRQDNALLADYLDDFFGHYHDLIMPYPWFTIGYDAGAYEITSPAYAGPQSQRPIGWDSVVELDFGWRRSFAELYEGLQVLDDFGIHYRAKFSGHHSQHFIFPAEAMPAAFRERPDKEHWTAAINKIGAFVNQRSPFLRDGWPQMGVHGMHSAPCSLHRTWGLAAVPLTRADYRLFNPWMASLALAAPVANWWDVPAEAGANFQALLDQTTANRRVFDMRSTSPGPPQYVAATQARAHDLAVTLAGATDQRQLTWRSMVQGRPTADQLTHPDAAIRWFAAESLAGQTTDNPIAQLQLLLFDNDEYVSQAAADRLCQNGGAGLERLLDDIDKSPSGLAFWAVQAWAGAGGTATIDTLVHYLRQGDPPQQRAAQSLLARLTGPASSHLTGLLSSDREDLRLTALSALLEQGEGARHILETAGGGLAQSALRALDRLDTPGGLPPRAVALAAHLDLVHAVPVLVHLLQSPDGKISYLAAQALTALGSVALPPLTDLLASPRTTVRRRVVEILRDVAAPESLPALRQALDDEDIKVRQNGVRGLARLGELSGLEALCQDPAPAVRRAVRQALPTRT